MAETQTPEWKSPPLKQSDESQLPQGWMPAKIHWQGNRPLVEWWDLRTCNFREPFFRQSLQHLHPDLHNPSAVLTTMETLASRARQTRGLPLRGFIFHMTRCGSTLVSRSLGHLPTARALGQPDFVVDLLDPPVEVPRAQRIAWLRDLVTLLAASPAHAPQKHLVIRWTSILSIKLQFFREAFPGVKWLFVYRNPLEVLVSVLRAPTLFMRMRQDPDWGARWLGMARETVRRMDDRVYAAQFLQAMCRPVIDGHDSFNAGEMIALDYQRLPHAIWERVLPHFGIRFDGADRARMQDQAALYSKDVNQVRVFRDDSREKRRQASPALKALCDGGPQLAVDRLRQLFPPT